MGILIGYMKTPPDLNDVYTGSLGETEAGTAAKVFLRGDICSGVYF